MKRLAGTAGRYGIDLTLYLLHDQRLVPNSCRIITSTIEGSSSVTRAKFVVDIDRDSVVSVGKIDLCLLLADDCFSSDKQCDGVLSREVVRFNATPAALDYREHKSIFSKLISSSSIIV